MRLIFGDGKIGVATARMKDETINRLVVLLQDAGTGAIGADIPGLAGGVCVPEDSSVQLLFKNPESAQVLIDALEKVKSELIAERAP